MNRTIAWLAWGLLMVGAGAVFSATAVDQAGERIAQLERDVASLQHQVFALNVWKNDVQTGAK